MFNLNYVSLVFEPVQKNQKGVWAQACLDASLPRDFLGRLVSRPLFDFSAAKRTNTHQDEVIILALAKSCYSTHNAPINVKPYYTPPGVHKGKVGI